MSYEHNLMAHAVSVQLLTEVRTSRATWAIRIGLLIADDLTLIYSPTAESIETENRQALRENGNRSHPRRT